MSNPKIKLIALIGGGLIGTIIITLPMRVLLEQQTQIIEIQKTINQ